MLESYSASGVSLACVASLLSGWPGVWKARSAQMDRSRSASIGELRAASAPPRGLLVNSGPHMAIFMNITGNGTV